MTENERDEEQGTWRIQQWRDTDFPTAHTRVWRGSEMFDIETSGADRLLLEGALNALEGQLQAAIAAKEQAEKERDTAVAKASLFDKLLYLRPDGWWLAEGVIGESKRINRRISTFINNHTVKELDARYDALTSPDKKA